MKSIQTISLPWFIPRQSDPQHPSPESVVVVDGIMLHTPIVPERNATCIPSKPARQLGLDLMTEQKLQQWRRFVLGPPFEVRRMRDIHIQRLAARLWMCADHGMHSFEGLFRRTVPAVPNPVFARLAGVGLCGRIHGLERGERVLETLGKRVIGGVLVGEERVAAERGHFLGE